MYEPRWRRAARHRSACRVVKGDGVTALVEISRRTHYKHINNQVQLVVKNGANGPGTVEAASNNSPAEFRVLTVFNLKSSQRRPHNQPSTAIMLAV